MTNIRQRKVPIQKDYAAIEAQWAQKKAQLDEQIKLEESAFDRLSNYNPSRDDNLMCPYCWVARGKESTLVARGAPRDHVRCEICTRDFAIA
jgi:hypothetical protein